MVRVRGREHTYFPFLATGLMIGLSVFALPGAAVAQVIPDTSSAEAIERALESLDEDAGDASQLVDFLSELRENPVDVNTASKEDLAQVPGLDELLAFAIVEFRNGYGRFASLPELQLVSGITEEVYSESRPYLTLGPVLQGRERGRSSFPPLPTLHEIATGLQFDMIQRVTRRLDLGRGYDDDTTRSTYSGGPERVYTRMRTFYGRRFSLNVTAEKDPGESFRWSPAENALTYDHVSAHMAIRDFGRVRTLVVGDYVAAFGQGLVFWKGLSAGKGRDIAGAAVRAGSGVSPYGSTDENKFLRGSALTFRLSPKLSVTGMYSRRSLDASITLSDPSATDSSDAGFSDVQESSLTNSGLHRTASELANRDAIDESLIGGNVEYVGRRLRLGAVGYRSIFAVPLVPGSAAYERFRFQGTDIGIASAYFSAFLNSYQLFGEVARDQDGNVAGVGGTSIRLGRSARAVVSVRHFPRSFTNVHSFGFGESNGATQNESGIYSGVQLRPSRRWLVSGYFDQYRFPWARFGVARPTVGHESLLFVEHKPASWLAVYLQLRSETKEQSRPYVDAIGRSIDSVGEETRESARLNLSYDFSRSLTLRSRVETVRFSAKRSEWSYGVLLFQDLQWRVSNLVRLDGRLMLFDTDSFDSRVFAYEYDLRYAFAIPSFSGRGQRGYLMLTAQPLKSVYFQFKYAVTTFENVETVGSGLDEFDGNRLREVRAQLQVRF